MIEQEGEVVACSEGKARIHVRRGSACARCRNQGGCGAGVLALALPGRQTEFLVPADRSVLPGARVRIGVPRVCVLRAAAMVYLLPLLMMLTAALLAQPWGDLYALIGGLGGLVLGLLLARWSVSMSSGFYTPVLLADAREPSGPRRVDSIGL